MTWDPLKPYNDLPDLSPPQDIETRAVLKLAANAREIIAKVDGFSYSVPNPLILIDTLSLQEAKDSCEIENIVTTTDELFKELAHVENINPHTKEVLKYRQAVYKGCEYLERNNVLSTSLFCQLASTIKGVEMSVRKGFDTKIQDTFRGLTLYTPPAGESIIIQKLTNLEKFIHTNDDLDPLVKLALIHYQFEAIHPFTDGNGRVGRILNILYLIQSGLLKKPIIYLSKHIIDNKNEYYEGLKSVTQNHSYEPWVVFMLKSIESGARNTYKLLSDLKSVIEFIDSTVKQKLPKLYSRELIELLFKHPYCKIQFLVDNNIAKRQTASEYLNALADIKVLNKIKIGRNMYFVNNILLELLG